MLNLPTLLYKLGNFLPHVNGGVVVAIVYGQRLPMPVAICRRRFVATATTAMTSTWQNDALRLSLLPRRHILLRSSSHPISADVCPKLHAGQVIIGLPTSAALHLALRRRAHCSQLTAQSSQLSKVEALKLRVESKL